MTLNVFVNVINEYCHKLTIIAVKCESTFDSFFQKIIKNIDGTGLEKKQKLLRISLFNFFSVFFRPRTLK